MVELVKKILAGQFEASLCMLSECIQKCPAEHWEGKIANDTFRQIAYHTLFYVDLYLSPSEEAFALRDLHRHGGDERGPALSPGLSQDETLAYAAQCRDKLSATLASETSASLAGPSGFSWRKFPRAELHIYNIRHVQHHAGQMSAYVRRIPGALPDLRALPWVATGWR